jgi:hypothetical protein
MTFSYKNIQNSMYGGKRMTRKVVIKNGKGHKSICTYKNGKKCYGNKKKLSESEIQSIKMGKFIPGLFRDLFSSKTKKNRK